MPSIGSILSVGYDRALAIVAIGAVACGTVSPTGGTGGRGSSSTAGTTSAKTSGAGGCDGVACAADELCVFVSCYLGTAPDHYECKKRPISCTTMGPVACGNDGMVYPNACEAAKAGHDLGTGCSPPSGKFACGDYFCDPAKEFCFVDMSDCAPTAPPACEPYPVGCAPIPPIDCSCFGGICLGAPGICDHKTGAITITCQ